MTTPGIITGGSLSLFKNVSEGTQPESGLGVFGVNPGATPKYAFNRKGKARDAESRESMARLFIEMPEKQVKSFLKSVSAEARPLAEVLVSGTGTGGSGGTGFIDFLMTNASENFQEKTQIVDTLTDNFVAFYSGQEPPLFTYSGVLLNTYQDDQRVWMLRLYREILRGTRLAARNLIARLRYDSFIVAGYLESLSLSLDGETEITASRFQFTMRVKRLKVITAALGAPTLINEGAVNSILLRTEAQVDIATERVVTVTPDSPPTAVLGPAADERSLSSSDDSRTRSHLRELGFSDAEIDAQLALAEAEVTPPEEDRRSKADRASKQGKDRVRIAATGTDANLTNVDNTTNDGVGGATNVYGNEHGTPASDADVLTKRRGNRARGQSSVSR